MFSGRRRAAAWFAGAALLALPPAAAGAGDADLKVVGRSDLGGGGGHVAVAAGGTEALVVSEAGAPCGAGRVRIVAFGNPRRPRLAGEEDLPFPGPVGGAAAEDDLVAVAAGGCPDRGGGVAFYRRGRLVGTIGPIAARAVTLGTRADARTVAAVVSAVPARVDVVDVTDPAAPAYVARWSPPRGTPVDAAFLDLGRRMFVLTDDGLVYDIDVSRGPAPATGPSLPVPGGRASSLSSLPLADRTIGIVSQPEGLRILDGKASPGGGAPGGAVRSAAGAAPGKVVASGDYAFVPWHEEGVRVIDLGGLHPTTLAAFAPGGDIVGVALLPNHILALDPVAGLYVLERPGEGGGGSWWDNAGVFLAGLGIAGLMAFIAVPRIATALAAASQGSRAPVPAAAPARVRRRVRPGSRR